MSDPLRIDPEFWPPAFEALVDEACDRFEAACQKAGLSGPLPAIEAYLPHLADPERVALVQELIPLDLHYRRQRGETPRPEEYRGRFPDLDAQWLAAAVAESQAPEPGTGERGGRSHSSSARDPLDDLAEEFAVSYRRGEQPSVTEYAEKHPQLAPRIRELFPALVAMEQARLEAGVPTGPFESSAGEGSLLPKDLGDYRLLREIGRGGMGVVYEAVQESLGRHVALKILPFHRLMGPTHLERFQREARAAAQLHHTNIVPVFGVGEAEGIHYYTMQYIQGQGLDVVLEEVQRLRGRGSRPSRSESSGAKPRSADTHSEWASQTQAQYCRSVAQVGVQVADALAYAHKQGILHRDIKPSNLLLDPQGTVWITDFGLAKTEGSGDLTTTGDMVGTVRYMAPERFQGQADPRSDVYSLGITLYEMLTLRPAFADANRARLVERVRQEEPPRLRALDPHILRDLETIVLKALAKEPTHRYSSAQAMAEDLRRFLNKEPVQARPVGQVERVWRWSKRNPALAGMSAAVLLLLLLVAGTASIGYVQTARSLSRERRLNYAWTMGAVQAAWENHNVLRVQSQLADTESFPDRGFEWYYWQRLCREHLTLVGHQGGVTAVAFAPDGQRLVTGGKDGTARVWDCTSGRELLCLRGHRRQVTSVAFAPDGRWLVTGSTDGTARIWDAITGLELRTLQRQHTGPVWAVAATPDGKRVVTGSEDSMARVWDSASGQVLRTLKGQTPLPVLNACLVGLLSSPQASGPFLAGASLYPGRTGHTGPVWAVAAFPDGRIVTGSEDGTARVWNVDSGRELLPPLQHEGGVVSVSASPDGRRILTGGGNVRLWDAVNGRELFNTGFTGLNIVSGTFAPDGKRMVTGGAGGVKFWDTANGREILTLVGVDPGNCVAVSPDGQRLATACLDGTAKLWDTDSGPNTVTLKGHTGQIMCLAVTPDGQRIVSAGEDGTARLWDAVNGRELRTLKAHSSAVRDVAVSPDAKWIVSGGDDGTAKLWDAASGLELQTLKVDTKVVRSVAVSPDGKRILTGGEDGKGRLWDAASGQELLTLKGHFGRVFCVAMTPDGRRLITGSHDNTVKFWDVVSGQEIRTFEGHSDGILCVAVVPERQRLVTGSIRGMGAVWDMATGRQLLSLQGHTGLIRAAAVTPDGQRIVTGGADGTAKLWDAVSGQELLTLKGHTGPVCFVAVTPDGQRIITGSEDGTVKFWEAVTPAQIELWNRRDQEAARRLAPWKPPAAGDPGFIKDWVVLAPLALRAEESGANGLEREQLPSEANLRPLAGQPAMVGTKACTWQAHHANKPILDFNRFVGELSEDCAAYAVCYVISESERNDLVLQVGSDDMAKVYLNGEEVFKETRGRPLVALDPIPSVRLHKGTNVLVLKVVNESLDWEACARFVDAEGSPAKGLRYSLTPEP
jgi:WD40 repeat protein